MTDNAKEISAIDVIYKLYDKITLMDKKIDDINLNIKLLSNKITKISKDIGENPIKTPVSGDKPALENKQSHILSAGNIKTFGYIINKQKKAISNVKINIYNDKNEIIRTKLSDENGYWEVKLPPGKYGIEYVNKGFKPINLSAEITNDMKEFAVK